MVMYVFTGEKLDEQLRAYEAAALATYPHRADVIKTIVAAVRDLFDSEFADPLIVKQVGAALPSIPPPPDISIYDP